MLYKPEKDQILSVEIKQKGGKIIIDFSAHRMLCSFVLTPKRLLQILVDSNGLPNESVKNFLLKEKTIPTDTMVWCKNYEEEVWSQRYYSHFKDGKHYLFADQKKSNQSPFTTYWNIVTTQNPFENN